MRSFRLGSVLGIEIRIDISWFILFFLLLWTFSRGVFPQAYPGQPGWAYYAMALAAALLFFASLLAHELSHSVVARRRGVPVDGITLFIFGGMARTRMEPRRAGDEFIIAGVGPLSSLLIGALFGGIWLAGEAAGLPVGVTAVAWYLALVNVALAVFNLLPGFPLDGGRLLRSAVWRLTRDLRRATRIATTGGRLLGLGLIAYGIWEAYHGQAMDGLWLAFIGLFLQNAARASYRMYERAGGWVRPADQEATVRGAEAGVVAPGHSIPRPGGPQPERTGMFVIPSNRLPAGFAERVDSPPQPPAQPRPAATVVIVRDCESGPEVLLLQRQHASGFVPGAYVFPGGRVDEEDGAAVLKERAGTLAQGANPALPYWMAAIREVFEETGVLLAGDATGRAAPDATAEPALAEWREKLLGRRASLADLFEAEGLLPAVGELVYCGHWITPVAEPRRYDTRFFAARLPAGHVAAVDSREMTDAVWITPEEALRRFQEGSLPMVFPTVKMLEMLAGFGNVAELLNALRVQPVHAVLPRLVRTPEGVGIEVEGSTGFNSKDRTA